VILIILSCAWIAGFFLGSNFQLPFFLNLIGLVPFSLLFFARRYRKPVILAGLSLFLLFTAAAYSYSSLHTVDGSRLRFYNDRGVVEIKGMVAEAPDVRDNNTRLKIAVTEIDSGEGWREVQGTALLFVPGYPAYDYGDVLQVTGELNTPPRLDDFDYKGYLAHQDIYTTMLYPAITRLDSGRGFLPMAWVYSLRSRLAQNLAQILPEPSASLAQGFVLGIRGNIPEDVSSDFARSGTAHLLAISGLHLGIIAGVVLSLGIWLFGRRGYLYVWLAIGFIWLYVLITGMHLPVVRGAIMASLFLFAELLGRQNNGIVSLFVAAAVMVGVHPYILGDVSFQLSFLAMAGLVFLFPVFRDLGRASVRSLLGEEGAVVSVFNLVADTWSASLAAVLMVWPVVAYYFGIVSLFGPLATFLVLPALPGIIMFSAIAALLGMVIMPVAQVVGWLAWLLLSYLLFMVHGLATPSVSSIEVSSVSPIFIGGYYLVIAIAGWIVSKYKRLPHLVSGAISQIRPVTGMSSGISGTWKWAIVALSLVAVLVSFTAATMPDEKVRVSFLDVGEGDAILIQKGSRQVLVDGGPGPQSISMELGRKMPFWDRTIDMVVLTHPHHDHLAGLVEVLKRYKVGQILHPALDYESPVYDEWLGLIEAKGIQTTTAWAGQQVSFGDGEIIDVLWPQPVSGDNVADPDNNSLVLRFSAGDISFLLTGDIMRETEWELIGDRASLNCTVLKVPHHGADTSTTSEFLAAVRPQLAIISAGAGNKYGHPDDEVLTRLETAIGTEYIYRTDIHGTVEFITDGERLWVKTDR